VAIQSWVNEDTLILLHQMGIDSNHKLKELAKTYISRRPSNSIHGLDVFSPRYFFLVAATIDEGTTQELVDRAVYLYLSHWKQNNTDVQRGLQQFNTLVVADLRRYCERHPDFVKFNNNSPKFSVSLVDKEFSWEDFERANGEPLIDLYAHCKDKEPELNEVPDWSWTEEND